MYNHITYYLAKLMAKAKKRATFFLPEGLIEELKIRAIKHKVASSEIVEEALREYLKKNR